MAAATVKKPYDPVKALEGMFNGSVTRIAYVLKDPTNFGASTKTVLAECAKRFQDALDDCEIQLLDAKWYLEHQLAENKARREAKEKENSTAAAKRKYEEQQEAEMAAKRAKTEQEKLEKAEAAAAASKLAAEAEQSTAEEAKATEPEKEVEKFAQDDTVKPEPEKPAVEQTSVEPEKPPEPAIDPQPVADDFAKPTPHATPVNTNEDFNFESMFGDPSVDGNDDMNLDLGLGDAFSHDPGANAQDSLDSLLPTLDSYTGQTSNDLKNTSQAAGDALPSFSNDFDLPDLGGPNAFDDFLNDDSLGTGNFEGNVDLTDEAFNNMSFDDMFDGDI